MPSKIQFAYEEYSRLINISERLDRSKSYRCPFCKEEVIAKKGNTRTHHFAHKPESCCSVTEETVLHFESKYYLQMAINNKKAKKITIPFPSESLTLINFLSKELNLNATLDITLQEIIDFYSVSTASVEYRLPNSSYIADVYCDSPDVQGILFEVLVTHEMELEKRIFLENNDFPYLELNPYYHNGNLEFHLHSYHLPEFLELYKNKIEQVLKEYLYPLYEYELLQKVEQESIREKIIDYKIEAVKALLKDIENDHFSDLYSNYLRAQDTHSTSTRVIAFLANVEREEPLTDIKYVTKKDKSKTLMGNGKKYYVSSEQNILYGLINTLLHQIEINALIGRRTKNSSESIVGFELMIPEPAKQEEIYIESIKRTLEGYLRKFEKRKGDK